MIPRSLLAQTWSATGCRGDWPAAVDAVVIDSRRVTPGALFVALPGQKVDGHDYLAQARAAGAAGALVARAVDDPLPQWVVPDVLSALQALALAWRQQWPGTLIGLTGSNGKTTVKEMLGAILAQDGPTCVTQGNLNNHLGVPLSLLRLRPEHRYAVIEMGANHAGEIAALTALTQPQVGLVTLAAAAHLEGFGSLEGVARAKGELYQGLPPGAVAVINADDTYAPMWLSWAAPRRILKFGVQGEVTAREVELGVDSTRYTLATADAEIALEQPTNGWHNVMNALAAASAALALGLSLPVIAEGLRRFRPPAGRLQITPLADGRRLIDDSYNANPGSVRAAINVLAAHSAPRLLCLGNMAELGDVGPLAHHELGHYARAQGIEGLWTCGELAAHASAGFGATARHFASREAMLSAAKAESSAFATILVKGSRSAGMDIIASALREGGADA